MQKTILCQKCHRAFEVAGFQREGNPVSQTITCPYSDCNGKNEILWPIEYPFFVNKISPKK